MTKKILISQIRTGIGTMMSKDAKDITVLIRDNGLYLGLAHVLAPHVKRVLYQPSWHESFPTVNRCVIGAGFEDVEYCADFWPIKDEVDLFVFPDLGFAGLQAELVSQGFPVWGSRYGEKLEIDREMFLGLLDELGLPSPSYELIHGLTNLSDYLKEKEDKFVKMSKFRGSMETWKWRNWDQSRGELDQLAVDFGPHLKEEMDFIVVDKLDSDLELCLDTYNIRGQFPKRVSQGWEWKDRAYLCRIQDTPDLPPQLLTVMEAFGPVLKKYDYTNIFGVEVRGEYVLDPFCRFPCPNGSVFSLYDNLAEIMWAGAHGVLIEPKEKAVFGAECRMTIKGEKHWTNVEMPEELRDSVSCGTCCEIDGVLCFPPEEEGYIGWIRANGNTIEETLKALYEKVELLPECVEVDTDAFVDLLGELKEAEEQGIEFTEQKLPEPEAALNIDT